jgi:hypothetical protein
VGTSMVKFSHPTEEGSKFIIIASISGPHSNEFMSNDWLNARWQGHIFVELAAHLLHLRNHELNSNHVQYCSSVGWVLPTLLLLPEVVIARAPCLEQPQL